MDSLSTLPRRTWLERASLAFATLCVLIGVAGLADPWLHLATLLSLGSEPLSLRTIRCTPADNATSVSA